MRSRSAITKGYVIGCQANEALYQCHEEKMSYGQHHKSGNKVIAYENGGVGFLVCGNKIIFVVAFLESAGGISIRDLISSRFLSSNPNKKDIPGSVGFNRDRIDAWEMFEIEEVSDVPSWLGMYFDALKNNPLGFVFDCFKHKNKVAIAFVTYALHSSSRSSIDNFMRGRLGDTDFLQGMLEAAAGNYLITPLIRGLLKNGEDAPCYIGVDKDIYGKGVNILNPWAMLNFSIRRCMKKNGKSCIVATARNEGVYLVEWIAYHRALGFDKIYIYTNNNQDGSLGLLKSLHDSGFITLVESDVGEGGNAQVKAYTHALIANAEVNKYEWCAFIDVDEYICYDEKKFSSFSDYLSWVGSGGADVVALSWVLAANKLSCDNWVTTPVTQRIRSVSPFQSNLIKCIARPESIAFSGPHYPLSTSGCALAVVNAERERYQFEKLDNPFDITRCTIPTFNNCYLYHYELKSFPELVWKYSRNRGNYSATSSDVMFNDHFMDRIGHFRKCMDNDGHSKIKLTVNYEKLAEDMSYIYSVPAIAAAAAAMAKVTIERYGRLVAYLPEYLDRKNLEERLIPAKDWILKVFVKNVKKD
jgi:hypothetical protein